MSALDPNFFTTAAPVTVQRIRSQGSTSSQRQHQYHQHSQTRHQERHQHQWQPETQTVHPDTPTEETEDTHDLNRLQPKLAFANERTFLAWIHFTVLLGAVAVGMSNFSHGDKAGDTENDLSGVKSPISVTVGMILSLAIAIMLYALYSHNRRASTIRHGEPPESIYADRFGPTFVLVSFFAVFTVNVVLRRKEFDLDLDIGV